ncbi:MAG: RhuM family protein [Bacteroidales bacterium]|jgi:hypothetical protein|nr:RhuM family protein [Bacteroidales bacterium]MDD3153142.1 RhuM family protein [Bacteroidales bacterium]MDD3913150.1 RhuM family protein [Bacteroidales bacterium]MDD4633065.1 RhuM family protein [Bacteroidales bacterium]
MGKDEIILYQPDNSVKLEVRVENETVWLNRHQIAQLFGRDVKTIGKHINNALCEELNGIAVVANFATTASDGKIYQVEHYNIEMITSVGYRVKSQRGIQFRQWANKVLKEYLLKGYSVNQRIESIEQRVNSLENKSKEFDLVVKTSLPPREGLFYDGQIFDAFEFVQNLIKSAQRSIVLIDNYIDDSVLTMLGNKAKDITVNIYTKSVSEQLKLAAVKFNSQYGGLILKEFSFSHDRFLIIDDKEIYLIGASLKDLGKKWFAFSKLDKSNIADIKKRLT